MTENNLLIVHGGGPTAVINASLYGAIIEAKKYPWLNHIYAARNGTGGLLNEDFIRLDEACAEDLKLLLQTPGSAAGNGVTEKFKDWCRPLIGEKLDKMISFN